MNYELQLRRLLQAFADANGKMTHELFQDVAEIASLVDQNDKAMNKDPKLTLVVNWTAGFVSLHAEDDRAKGWDVNLIEEDDKAQHFNEAAYAAIVKTDHHELARSET